MTKTSLIYALCLESSRAQDDQSNREGQANDGQAFQTFRRGDGPVQNIARAPRRNHEPHAHDHDDVSPNDEDEPPWRIGPASEGQRVPRNHEHENAETAN